MYVCLIDSEKAFSRVNSGTVTEKKNYVFIYGAVSSLIDRPKCLTFHPLAALFIPTPTRLILGRIKQCGIYCAKMIHSHFLLCL